MYVHIRGLGFTMRAVRSEVDHHISEDTLSCWSADTCWNVRQEKSWSLSVGGELEETMKRMVAEFVYSSQPLTIPYPLPDYTLLCRTRTWSMRPIPCD